MHLINTKFNIASYKALGFEYLDKVFILRAYIATPTFIAVVDTQEFKRRFFNNKDYYVATNRSIHAFNWD